MQLSNNNQVSLELHNVNSVNSTAIHRKVFSFQFCKYTKYSLAIYNSRATWVSVHHLFLNVSTTHFACIALYPDDCWFHNTYIICFCIFDILANLTAFAQQMSLVWMIRWECINLGIGWGWVEDVFPLDFDAFWACVHASLNWF